MGKKNSYGLPFIYDLDTYISMDIDPNTGKRMNASNKSLKNDIRKLIRIQDEQDFVNSIKWYGLPGNISGQELERILYYKGSIALFYMKELDDFYFMPYTVEAPLDFYGRPNIISPRAFHNSEKPEGEEVKLDNFLSGLKLKVQKGIKIDELTIEDFENSAVILKDYTPQIGQTILPRAQLQEPIMNIEADIPCYLRTALKNSTGVQGMRVNDQSAYSNVQAAEASMDTAVLEGHRFVPIISPIEMQDLASGTVIKSEEYLESLQSIDNLRKGFIGCSNSGLFQKKAHMLESEQAMNTSTANSALQDRLTQRQHFCDIANSIWGLGIWCEPAEGAIDADMDGDGTVVENNSDLNQQDPQGGAAMPAEGSNEE